MILTKQSEKVDNRMEGVTIDTPKEKLGTPGFLKSIGSIFSKLSLNNFKDDKYCPNKLTPFK